MAATSVERHIPLPGGAFGVWPWAVLRATGFPARHVLALAAPETAARIERLLDAGEPNGGAAIPDALRRSFEAEDRRIGEALRATARDPRFREAVTWQNRHVARTAVDRLASKSIEQRNKDVRQKERCVAAYLQRYCVKNDTIGFFGPVGWIRIGSGPDGLTLRLGRTLLEQRKVYFESWCIDALAERLSQDAELLPWATPRLLSHCRLEGTVLHMPGARRIELDTADAAILRRCDGTATARAVAGEILSDPSLSLAGEADVFACLQRALAMRAITWSYEVPAQLHPEAALRRAIERIDSAPLRERALAPLLEIEDARDRISAAAGDAAALDSAIEHLETTFQRLTHVAPTRAEGRTYAARTLAYEECRRDLEMEVGAPVLDKLGPPLSLLLTSARWMTYEVGQRYRDVLSGLFDRLAARGGRDTVELTELLFAFVEAEPSLKTKRGTPRVIEAVQQELARRWAEILGKTEGARHLSFNVDDLAPLVRRAFDAPRAGWQAVRYGSPDVMIAARGVEAIRKGDYRLVLGELHIFNTIRSSLFISQHPSIEELFALWERDNPAPGVVPILPKAQWPQRTNQDLMASYDLRHSYTSDPSPAPPAQTLRAADLVVARGDGGIEVMRRDKSVRIDLLEFMGTLLSSMIASTFSIMPAREHTPRVQIGDLVVARESFCLVAEQATFASLANPLERWIEAKRWQRLHGIPRFIFYKVPIEVKPCFADLDSPIYVDMLSKHLRQTAQSDASATISITEMLPDFDDLWLPDAAGELYTAELRMVMFAA